MKLLQRVAAVACVVTLAGGATTVAHSAPTAGTPTVASVQTCGGPCVASDDWPWPWPWPWPTPTPTTTPSPTSTAPSPTPTTPTPTKPTSTPTSGVPDQRPELLRGRRAVDHVHTDAVSVVWENDEMVIKSKVGRDNVDSDSVYFNLQESYHEGRDVSKFTIPEGRAGELLTWLGKPGDTFWSAPGKYYRGWKPIWAGFAFDVPDEEVESGSMRLELVRVEGPSWVETMTYHADPLDPDPSVYRRISSRATDLEGRSHRMHMNRYHMHLTWVFGKPGTYDMVFKMTGKTTSGRAIESKEQSIIWQVGPTP